MNTRIWIAPLALGAGLALALSAAAVAQDGKKEVHSEVIVMSGDGHGEPGGPGMHMRMMGGPHHPPLAEMDTNKDGVVSKEEFMAFHAAMYDKMAAEHGGSLKVPPPPVKHDIKIIVDGKELKPGEMPPGMEMMEGGDGPGMRTFTLRRGEGGEGGDHNVMIMRHGPGGPDGPGEHMKMGEPMRFEAMDKNHDGKISFEEFAGPMRQAFEHLDANHDGSLSKEELAKAHMNVRVETRVRDEKHDDKH